MIEGLKVKGFSRLQIEEDGRIVGDSGYCNNTVTNDGMKLYLVHNMIGSAGALSVSHGALGTGTAPGAAATTLDGEIVDAAASRAAVVAATNGSTAAQFTMTFAGSDVLTATKTIQNIGLFQTSTTNVATIMAGNTFATSQFTAAQSVNVTYNITFT